MKTLYLLLTIWTHGSGNTTQFIPVDGIEDCNKKGSDAVILLYRKDYRNEDKTPHWNDHVTRHAEYECIEI